VVSLLKPLKLVSLRTSKQGFDQEQQTTFQPSIKSLKQVHLDHRASVCVKLYRSFVSCQAQFSPNHNIFVTKQNCPCEISNPIVKVITERRHGKLKELRILRLKEFYNPVAPHFSKSLLLRPGVYSSACESRATDLDNDGHIFQPRR
jgi:hypothetical protein